MAYGIGEENITKYLIEHGADQEALDDDGRKPKDCKFYRSDKYSVISMYLFKQRVIYRNILGPEFIHFMQLCIQGKPDLEALDCTFEKFPSLQKYDQRNLEATPTLKELNQYITDMAPSYDRIGLELDIVNSQIKLIRNDPSLPSLKEKCLKMLEVWLENDTSATWKKLCGALRETGQSVLAEKIAKV